MCQRVTCSQCGKPTFAGCGRHVEQVLGDVPPVQRCKCRESSETQPTSTQGNSGSVLETLKSWLR
jgi:hypothetical protein